MPKMGNLLPFSHSVVLLALMTANALAAVWAPILCWLTVPLAAFAMCCALSVVHECAHRTYFTSRRANDLIGRSWALAILMNFSAYRRDHMLHHRHQGTDRDTEPQIVLGSRKDLIRAIVANPHVLPSWLESSLAALHRKPAPQGMRRDGQLLLAVQVAVLAMLIWDWKLGLLAFILPFVFSTMMDNIVSLPEHARLTSASSPTVTRSMTAPRPFEFLLYSVGRHIEHHYRPQVSVARCLHEPALEPVERYVAVYAAMWTDLRKLKADGNYVRQKLRMGSAPTP